MKIRIKDQLIAADLRIPPGEYAVGLVSEQRVITLSGHGETYKLPAMSRPSKTQIRTTTILFFPAMTPDMWTILVKSPPRFEWVAYLRKDKKA